MAGIGGGLLQLVAYGAQDDYLMADQDIGFNQNGRNGPLIKVNNKRKRNETDKSMFHVSAIKYLEICGICHENMTNVKLMVGCPDCKKCLHKCCMDTWTKQHRTCPYCRSDIWSIYN